MTHMTRSVERFLLDSLTLQEADEVLRQIQVGEPLREMMLLMFRHRFHAGKVLEELIHESDGRSFEALQKYTYFHSKSSKLVHMMFDYVETAPTIHGTPGNYRFRGYDFMKYESFMLEDGRHLILVARLDAPAFEQYWGKNVTTRDYKMFNLVHVYEYDAGEWKVCYDHFADQYRSAYEKMLEIAN